MTRFGESIKVILDRETYFNESVLSQYENILKLFSKYYVYEEIKGALRETKEIIPERGRTGETLNDSQCLPSETRSTRL